MPEFEIRETSGTTPTNTRLEKPTGEVIITVRANTHIKALEIAEIKKPKPNQTFRTAHIK